MTLISFILVDNVKAAEFNTVLANSYKINTTYGNKVRLSHVGWGGKGSPYKGVDSVGNLNAYCIAMKHSNNFRNCNNCSLSKCTSKAKTLLKNDNRAITAGYIINVINDSKVDTSKLQIFYGDYSDAKKISDSKCKSISKCDPSKKEEYLKYVYKVLTLNTYFSKFSSVSWDFTKTSNGDDNNCGKAGKRNDGEGSVVARKCNSAGEKLAKEIKEYISDAEKLYDKNFKDNSLPAPKITGVSNRTLKRNGNFYITSTALKFSQNAKLKNDTTISNTFKNNLSNGTVQYCTNSKGTGCVSIPVIGTAYYVKIIPNAGANLANKKVQITITSSAKFNYPYISGYCKNKSMQTLGVRGIKEKSMSVPASITLSIPPEAVKPSIEIQKVDNVGEPLAGAKFELKDSSNRTYALTTSDNKIFRHEFDSSVDISKLSLSLSEITTPNGYVTHANINNIVIGSNSTKYYKVVVDENSPDEEINEARYNAVYKCSVVTTENSVASAPEYKDLVDGTCESYNLDGMSTDTGDGTTSDGGTTSGDGTTSDGGTTSGSAIDVKTVKATKVCFDSTVNQYKEAVAGDDCDSSLKYSVSSNASSVFIEFPNELNTVKIDKKDVTGNEEVPGAHLKICKEENYKKDLENCKPATSINNVELDWDSGDTAKEFAGIPNGTYYIIETLPPSGYKLVQTATEFSIDSSGDIKIGDTKATDGTIVINNALNEVTISKTDIVTTKELPGAKLEICIAGSKKSLEELNADDGDDDDEIESTVESTNDSASDGTSDVSTTATSKSVDEEVDDSDSTDPNDYVILRDDEGNCVVPSLAGSGDQAVWVSGDKPHTIRGLPYGTYFLVETTAPYGYATAESILFKMTPEGILTDIAGNSLKDNKIVMKDAPIKQVKTGNKALIITIIGALMAAVASVYFFGFHKVAHAGGIDDGILKRVKTRKIHKK